MMNLLDLEIILKEKLWESIKNNPLCDLIEVYLVDRLKHNLLSIN